MVGTYYVIYNLSDSEGNTANQAVRIVNVIDTIKPIIYLIGDSIVYHEKDEIYNRYGLTDPDFIKH